MNGWSNVSNVAEADTECQEKLLELKYDEESK
jgi:hypothetical protein